MADRGMNMDYFKNNRLDNTYKRAITDYSLKRTFIELNCDAEKDYWTKSYNNEIDDSE